MKRLWLIKKHGVNLKASYLEMIRNSVGSEMFRSLYLGKDRKDILESGKFSCAIHVSSILYLWGLMGDIHATVSSTLKDLEDVGWYKVKELKEGAVILWDFEKADDGTMHQHLGFFIGKDQAVSNNAEKGCVIQHHYTYGIDKKGDPKRKILTYYWHKALD